MNLSKREQSLLQAFYDVEKFNEIAGAPHNYQTVLNKLKIVLEEVYETLDAVSIVGTDLQGNAAHELSPVIDTKELLDGVVDIIYTVFALPKELEALGYDVFGALETVCENNNTKFVKTASEVELSVRWYASQGVECKSVYNEKHDCYSIVDINQKVRKPLNYKSVELKEFLPKGE